MIWKNCRMTIVYFDSETADEGMVATVKIDGSKILLEYEDETDDGASVLVQYVGKERGAGHYELTCPDQNGKASLHCFPEAKILEGFWVESSYRGMWRIHLKE
jgi:hypothetical protein